MTLVLEENKELIYPGQEQAPSVEKSSRHSCSLKRLWKSGWKITKVGVLLWPHQVCLGSWEFVWWAGAEVSIFLSVTTRPASGTKALLQLHPATGNVDIAVVV